MCAPYHFSVLFMLGRSNLKFYPRFCPRTLHLNFVEGKGSSLFLSLSPDIEGGVLACGAPNSNAERKEKKNMGGICNNSNKSSWSWFEGAPSLSFQNQGNMHLDIGLG